MSGRSWLVDGKRIATKIKSASENFDPKRVAWKSNPSRACPNCSYIIDNSDVTQEWPGLPSGVKFDPSDQEIISHLLAKVNNGNQKPHPFIEEFIPTVSEEHGICYSHPNKLPGVKQDGSVSHFFHRTIKAYNTGTRKRRKIHGDGLGDVRWHKTGRTKPVILDGTQMGCKKIMVLYMSTTKTSKPEKTNWVMHQYHLGTGEEEKEGEFVVSKVFYQQQAKPGDKAEQDPSCDCSEAIITKVDPVTPKSMIPEPPRADECHSDIDPEQERALCLLQATNQNPVVRSSDEMPVEGVLGDHSNHIADQENVLVDDRDDILESQNPFPDGSQNLLSGESLYLIDSEQLAEGMALCDEFLQSQPSSGEGEGDGEEKKSRSCLSDYSLLGVKALKMDLEETHKLARPDFKNDDDGRFLSDHVKGAGNSKQEPELFQNMSHLDPLNIELDTPPEFRLSQLEFGSQDSFSAWAGSKFSE